MGRYVYDIVHGGTNEELEKDEGQETSEEVEENVSEETTQEVERNQDEVEEEESSIEYRGS